MWPKSFTFSKHAADEVIHDHGPTTEPANATAYGSTVEKHVANDTEKQAATGTDASVNNNSDQGDQAPEERPNEAAQEGVRTVEAITLVWTKTSLILVLVSIWFIYFMNAFQQSITSNLTPFVVSDFEAHSLIPATYIVSNVMAGSLRLTVAKMLDLWGRPQGFAVMITIATLGLIMMAACKNVQTFAAAQVFYTVGFDGAIYSCDVVTSDASTLRNRGLAFAFTASPYIITAFAGPKAAEGFYEKISWRWAFGTFSILIPVVALPLFGLLRFNLSKAKKQGLLDREKSGRTLPQSIWYYIVELDALGIFLFASGFALFLLPFSLADAAPHHWRTGYIIAMLVLGILLLIAFVLCERFISPKPFLPFQILTSRTVIGTCLLCGSFQVAYYCWNSYWSSYLQVVHGLTIAQAGYVSGVFDVVSGLWIFVVGFLIRRTNRFKWLLMCAVPLDILGLGLMIHFRQPGTNIGYVVMCQIFIAFSGGTIILTQQISIQSVVSHAEFAAVLALLGLFGYIGGAVGNTISGAIWTNTLPGALDRLLPDYAKENATAIYDDLDLQLSYEMGDPVREAIIAGYGLAQRNMCIAAVAIMSLSLVWVMMIKNINVAKVKQVKGIVL